MFVFNYESKCYFAASFYDTKMDARRFLTLFMAFYDLSVWRNLFEPKCANLMQGEPRGLPIGLVFCSRVCLSQRLSQHISYIVLNQHLHIALRKFDRNRDNHIESIHCFDHKNCAFSNINRNSINIFRKQKVINTIKPREHFAKVEIDNPEKSIEKNTHKNKDCIRNCVDKWYLLDKIMILNLTLKFLKSKRLTKPYYRREFDHRNGTKYTLPLGEKTNRW